MSKKIPISNRFNVEWNFAKKVYDFMGSNDLSVSIPEVPKFSTWEVDPMGGGRKLVKQEFITPQKVTRNGRTLFGD